MTITPEQLAHRLDAELAALPVLPRCSPRELRDRARRRRSRRRRGPLVGGVALLAAAAAVIALLVLARSTPQVRVSPGGPGGTGSTGRAAGPFRPGAVPARAGDVDGDGRADAVSISGRVLTVVGTRVGRLSLTLPEAGDTLAGRPLDIGDTGFADIVVRSVDFPGQRYLLVALADPHGAHPSLGVVATTHGQTPDLISDGGAGIEQSWTCQAADGTLNRPGLLVTVGRQGPDLTRTSYLLSGDRATQVATSSVPAADGAAASAVAAETLCGTAPAGGALSAPAVGPSTGNGTASAYGGIDDEQFGAGLVPDGVGPSTSYAGQPLVRRAFPGGSVQVPAGWVVRNQTLPSDHTDVLVYDPANPTARFEFSESGCVGCASQGGDGRTPDPAGPAGTISAVRLPGGRSVAFTERSWLGYAVHGVEDVLTGAQGGTSGPVGGYALYRVALPATNTALETTILDSVRLT